jgi:hypothetical protein
MEFFYFRRRIYEEYDEGMRRINIKFFLPILYDLKKKSKFLQSLDRRTRRRLVRFSKYPKCRERDFEYLFYLYCQWYDEMFWYFGDENLEEFVLRADPRLEPFAYRRFHVYYYE